MCSVTRSESPSLSMRHVEFERGSVQSKKTALKSHCYVYSAIPRNGKVYVEYGRATIKVKGDAATVKLRATTGPCQEMVKALEGNRPIPQLVEEFRSPLTIHSSVFQVPVMDGIRTFALSANLIDQPAQSPILAGIKLLCETLFPNIDRGSSNIHLRHGLHNWSANELLGKKSDGALRVTITGPFEHD